ncbi:MAG: dTDP-4-dehydrorhamnose 3,5-epimerase [Bacteroidales bacterium]|nr:dTDP-4-dehydrorhamnose 3,5-epimerase [Bacteroidales bacterium]
MKVKETGIEGLLVLEPRIFEDPRGFFYESYHKERLDQHGVDYEFIQDNQSRSSYGVIRGLHYQKEPHTQSKLVRVTEGAIFDVVVDIRPGSPTYGKWFGLEISAENFLQLLIPGGFAHGLSVLSDHATVLYKCDRYYHPESESGIRFDDPDLQIDWRIDPEKAIVSEKDRILPYLKQLKT